MGTASDLHNIFRRASDPDTDSAELSKLAMHYSEIVRGAVALNSSTKTSDLEILSNDCSEHVREAVKQRK